MHIDPAEAQVSYTELERRMDGARQARADFLVGAGRGIAAAVRTATGRLAAQAWPVANAGHHF